MIVVARLLVQGRLIDEYPFLVVSEDDFRNGARDAYVHFRRLHPEVRLFADGVIVAFGGEEK